MKEATTADVFCCSQIPPSLKDADLFAAFPSCEYPFSIHVGCYLGQACYCKIEQRRVALTLLYPPDLTLESLFSWKLSPSIYLQDDIKALCQKTGRNYLWEIHMDRLCWCCVICKKSLEKADVGHVRSVWHRDPISVPPCFPCSG